MAIKIYKIKNRSRVKQQKMVTKNRFNNFRVLKPVETIKNEIALVIFFLKRTVIKIILII